MSEAARLEAEGDAMAQHGVLAKAALAYDQAARLYRDSEQREDASRMLSKLAVLDQLVGDLDGALDAIDRALALPASDEARAKATMLRASVLDARGDARALVAWTHAFSLATDASVRAICSSHMIGILIGHGDFSRIQQLRATLEKERELTNARGIECIGGAGQSAGPHGTSLLAQAVLALHRHPDAWSFTTSAFWEQLVGRVDGQLAIDLCGLGSRLTLQSKVAEQHGLLTARVELVIARVAKGRSMTVDALLAEIERDPDDQRMVAALRALVPDDHWVIARD